MIPVYPTKLNIYSIKDIKIGMKLLLCADTIIQYNINNDKFLHYSTSKAPIFFSKAIITIKISSPKMRS